jgi:DNA-directed RNA polymerase specialized sigma24 family protein
MLYHPQDAEDATQEILIKVLARLSSFEGRSQLRIWLYRIVVNYVLNMKRGRVEDASMNSASSSRQGLCPSSRPQSPSSNKSSSWLASPRVGRAITGVLHMIEGNVAELGTFRSA